MYPNRLKIAFLWLQKSQIMVKLYICLSHLSIRLSFCQISRKSIFFWISGSNKGMLKNPLLAIFSISRQITWSTHCKSKSRSWSALQSQNLCLLFSLTLNQSFDQSIDLLDRYNLPSCQSTGRVYKLSSKIVKCQVFFSI